jgi:hypothetical protein
MICYQDRTFCQSKDCAKFKDCPRALTSKVKADAVRWWGSKDAPISIAAKFDCYEAKQ